MVFLGELRVQATTESIRTISHFLGAIGQRLKLTEKAMFDIDLALDEAAANIVKHAYPGLEKGDMVVTVDREDDRLRIVLTDWGVPLDPENVKPFDIYAAIETRIHGGMGLHFIHQLMDGVERSTASEPNGANKLILTKKIDQLRAGVSRTSSTRELRALMNVSEAVAGTNDQGELLTTIVNQLVNAIDAERGTLYLVDEDTGELVSKVLQEDTSMLKEIRLQIGEGVAGQVAQTGKIVNLEDVENHADFISEYATKSGLACHNMLVAPMRNPQHEIIGVVQLFNKRGGRFSQRDERLLVAIAAQAAISVENARLYGFEMERQLLDQELETARAIQASFLPQLIPEIEGWEIAVYWKPMREVAGDFYDFYETPDGRLALLIADVSGKGIPASLFMAVSVTVLRFAMSLGLSPGEMLDRANKAMLADQTSRMFTTGFVGYLDQQSGIMEYASAGHNPPLLYRQTQDSFEYLAAPGVAIGVFATAQFANETVQLHDGDIVIFYTDGITEVINDEEEEFGEERLELICRQYGAASSAQEITDRIMQQIHAHSQAQGSFDDETLVVIKRKSS